MKIEFFSQILKIGLVAAAVMSSASTVYADQNIQCKATIDAALDKYNIDKSTIKKMYILNVINGGGRGGGGYVAARNGWVDFNSCKGSIVVKMSPNCDFEEIYTRYGCDFPGIKHY